MDRYVERKKPIQINKGFICFYPPTSLVLEFEGHQGVWVYPKLSIKNFGSNIKVQFYQSDGCVVDRLVKDGWIGMDDEFTQRRVKRLLMREGVC